MAILAPLTVVFIVASVALVLIILVQRPQGGGLAGAFGGAGGGGTDTAFGGRTGDVLTVATVGAFVLYLGLAITLNILDSRLLAPPSPEEPTPVVESGAETTPAPAAPAAPTGTASPATLPSLDDAVTPSGTTSP